ncbi:MAG: TauD/TfdA family dioxygenase [Pseudomonadota bacterium]
MSNVSADGASEAPCAPRMLHQIESGPMAWRSESVRESDWKVAVPADCVAELATALNQLELEQMPMLAIDPGDYCLDACTALMADARERLNRGFGVVVLDRFPVEDYSSEQVRSMFWLLGTLLGRPVSQSIQGEMMVDVRDTGIPKRVGVRGFRTNYPQRPHTDNSFNHCPPDHVSLLSLRKAAEGGVSHFISFYTVHNVMLERYPDLLPRLYEPFYQDRQGDFRAGEPQTVFYPVFTYDGELRSRYTHFTIPAGYATEGLAFEGIAKAAFDAVTGIVEDPSLACSFTIEPGQLQIVNNRSVGHGRGEYRDDEDPARRRHLLRLWHRDWGRRAYGG